MKSPIRVSIPQPCSEDWESMTPAARGRFCAACQKTVVDFTAMSDAQILAFRRKQQGKPFCGRFSTQQLNRDLVPAAPASKSMLFPVRIAASLLGLQLLGGSAAAQRQSLPPSTQQPADRERQPGATLSFGGRLKDEISGEPLAGVWLQLESLGFSACTEKDGTFTFLMPAGTAIDRSERIVLADRSRPESNGLTGDDEPPEAPYALRPVRRFSLREVIGTDSLVLEGCECRRLVLVRIIEKVPPIARQIQLSGEEATGGMPVFDVGEKYSGELFQGEKKKFGWLGLRRLFHRKAKTVANEEF